MLWRIVTAMLRAVMRLIAYMLAAFACGGLIGVYLGKRNVNTYVHEFLPRI